MDIAEYEEALDRRAKIELEKVCRFCGRDYWNVKDGYCKDCKKHPLCQEKDHQ